MKFRKIRVTQVASIAFVLFAALLYFVINPRWVPDNRLFGVSPRTVPNLCAFAFAALGIALFLETLGKKAKADPSIIELSPRGIRMMVISFASVIAWAVCVKTTHYIPTVAVLLCVDMLALGQRNWKIIILVMILFPLIFWALFTYGFKMQLP